MHRRGSSTEFTFKRDSAVVIGTCEPCGKRIFLSRKVARNAARTAVSSIRPRAYRCPRNDLHWHVGHIPAAVRQGVISFETWLAHKDKNKKAQE